MARFHAAGRGSGIGSATLPFASLYATAACRPRVVEVGVFNSTATAVVLKLQRVTTTGTQGATVTASFEDDSSQTAVATAKDAHTVAPTLGGVIRYFSLGAAIGSGVIWSFGGGKTPGLIIPNTTGDGLALIVATGTGQICDWYFVWDE